MEYPDVRPVTTPSVLLSLEGGGYFSLPGRVGDLDLGVESLGLRVGCLWNLVLGEGGAVAEPVRALGEGVGYLGLCPCSLGANLSVGCLYLLADVLPGLLPCSILWCGCPQTPGPSFSRHPILGPPST